ncbi:MAG TPA: hypothetical protein VKD08_03460 [Ignavibacteriaceae bacterium]|nr:hypothetical protein [Ignavibacteriaceae bacterium]
MSLGIQIIWLVILALPVAAVSWTVTHEEVFRELHEFCVNRSKNSRSLILRKFFFLFTCEYCFSHYIVIIFLIITGFKMLLPDWRGFIISGFSLVWIANVYMSIYAHLRLDIKKERIDIETEEKDLNGGKGRS